MATGLASARRAGFPPRARHHAGLPPGPRLPAPLVADVTVAFLDGLAGEATVEPEANHRLRFDVFWLSVLNLAE